jgi:hypothetical protein
LNRSLSVGALSTLLLTLPFEPRRPTLPVLGLELTLLELVAAAAAAVLLYANRDRLGLVLRHPPLPVALLWAYVAASAVSAAVAPLNRVLAAKFVLRMAAAAVVSLAVAAAPREAPRRSALALTLACAVVAALAMAEGMGLFGLDPFLDRFRDGPYWVGTARRATAGSESPNLAAAMLVYGLLPAVGAATLHRRPALVVVPLTVLFSLGVLFTDSRGGLLALTSSLLTLGLALAARGGRAARVPALALSTLLAATVAFAASKGSLRPLPSLKARAPSHGARYAPEAAFLALAPREVHEVALTVTNAGSREWSAATLGCSWRRAEAGLPTDWQATSVCPVTPVPRTAPGDSVRVHAAIRAPDAKGRYVLVLDLVADGWVFSSLGVAPATVPAVVSRDPATAAPFAHAVPAATWRRDRAALWRAALALWRDHPLTGIGPDNFRWAHGGEVSPPQGDVYGTLVPANNVFLEAAATTGTLGLLALVGTFAATIRAAGRGLSRSAPGSAESVSAAVLLALTVAIVVHGMVDSFLGFTAHYLFMGLVVGAAGIPAAARPGSPRPGGGPPRWDARRRASPAGPAA